MYDLGFLNGKIYLNGAFIEANLFCNKGKVSAITTEQLECTETVNAEGKMILPGFIDPHVHFASGENINASSDNFYSGSIEAALGGITTFIDSIGPVRDIDGLYDAFEKKQDMTERSVVDYGVHTILAGLLDDASEFLQNSVELGMPTVKLFTTYSANGRRTYDRDIAALLKSSKKCEARIVAHAENDDLLADGGQIPVSDLETSRPAVCERTAALNLCELAKSFDGLLYISNLSAGTTVKRIREQYGELLHRELVLESCPQYFRFDSSVYGTDKGSGYTMIPPLRSKRERDSLRCALDTLDVMGTDHHLLDFSLKQGKFLRNIPMGVSGLHYAFSSMYTLFGDKILPYYTENPAKIEGLYPHKGTLAPGADADVVVFDPETEWTVDDEKSIYHGMSMLGKVSSVFSHAKCVVQDDQFVGEEGTGSYQERKISVQ
ncbi:MAG TPA: dihydropyrimidinase [Ruminococcaceae bacterium]|nr:dihydropyrimidinase [Oscillospiraceae bacterium]